jgi:hypothetical protein
MILAKLAMGTGRLPPCAPSRPTPGSPTAAFARPGQSGRGVTPGNTRTVVTEAVSAIDGTGRNKLHRHPGRRAGHNDSARDQQP